VTQSWLGPRVPTPQELLERVAEVLGAQSVDERVGCRVAVAEPEEDVEEYSRRAVTTERLGEVDSEERSPADHETADDDADRLGSFLLLVQIAQLRDDVQFGEA